MGAGASVASEEEMRAISVFHRIDINCDGALQKEEIKKIITLSGISNVEETTDCFQVSCDTNDDGKVSLNEWLKMFANVNSETPDMAKGMLEGFEVFVVELWEKRIMNLYRAIDINDDGFLSREELFHLLANTQGVENMLEEADKNHDGKLSLQEWKEMFKVALEKDVNTACKLLSTFEKTATKMWIARTTNVFKAIDINRDDFLSRTELIGFMSNGGDENAEIATEKLIAKTDENKDDKLSLEEWHNMFKYFMKESSEKAIKVLISYEKMSMTLWVDRITNLFNKIQNLKEGAYKEREKLIEWIKESGDETSATLINEAYATLKSEADSNMSLEGWLDMFRSMMDGDIEDARTVIVKIENLVEGQKESN